MYLGTNYHGLASQRNVTTIESELFLALTKKKYITNENTYIFPVFDYAGRTDRGVHARGMVFGFFNSRSEFHPMEVNGELPKDICIWAYQKIYDKQEINFLLDQIKKAMESRDEKTKIELLKSFKDPRHFALNRHYKYLIYNPNMNINIENLQNLLNKFIGFHDYSSFAKKDEGKLTYRSIDSIEVTQNQGFIEISFKAKSFLWNQIRKIMGAVFKVINGRWSERNIDILLKSEDALLISQLNPASPNNLILWDISYPPEIQFIECKKSKTMAIESLSNYYESLTVTSEIVNIIKNSF